MAEPKLRSSFLLHLRKQTCYQEKTRRRSLRAPSFRRSSRSKDRKKRQWSHSWSRKTSPVVQTNKSAKNRRRNGTRWNCPAFEITGVQSVAGQVASSKKEIQAVRQGKSSSWSLWQFSAFASKWEHEYKEKGQNRNVKWTFRVRWPWRWWNAEWLFQEFEHLPLVNTWIYKQSMLHACEARSPNKVRMKHGELKLAKTKIWAFDPQAASRGNRSLTNSDKLKLSIQKILNVNYSI